MTPTDPFEIPAFLRLTAEERAAARRLAKRTEVRDSRKRDYTLPKTLDAVGKAMLKAQRKEKAQRLLALRKARKERRK